MVATSDFQLILKKDARRRRELYLESASSFCNFSLLTSSSPDKFTWMLLKKHTKATQNKRLYLGCSNFEGFRETTNDVLFFINRIVFAFKLAFYNIIFSTLKLSALLLERLTFKRSTVNKLSLQKSQY